MDWPARETDITAHKPRTAADHVADILREAIAEGSLPPGRPLRQDELAKQFSFSRMPVRDALRILEGEGVVLIHPTRGAFVAKMDAVEISEVFAIRELLEVEALRLAFSHLTESILREAGSILYRIDEEPNAGRWGTLNRLFHLALYSTCGNARLLGLIEAQHNICDRYVRVLLSNLDYRARSQDEHRKLLVACQAGKEVAGLKCLTQHLRDGSSSLVQSVSATSASP
jgi:DNA-binding GntR family transcriptional regulator